MKIGEYIEAFSYDTAFWMAGVWNPEYPIDQLGDLSLEVSRKLRAMAIMVLVARADTDTFYHNLIRSGMARETYLQRCRNSLLTRDHHLASGRYEPLLDAVAAGAWQLAKIIVSLSPTEYMEGHEYEDDYCYAQILHVLIDEGSHQTRIPELLDRFERYVERQPSARLELAGALVSRRQSAFESAFDALLRERDRRIEADKERRQLEEPDVMALRRVFVEGLAILRLAERLGLQTEHEYRYCPSLARLPMHTPFPGE